MNKTEIRVGKIEKIVDRFSNTQEIHDTWKEACKAKTYEEAREIVKSSEVIPEELGEIYLRRIDAGEEREQKFSDQVDAYEKAEGKLPGNFILSERRHNILLRTEPEAVQGAYGILFDCDPSAENSDFYSRLEGFEDDVINIGEEAYLRINPDEYDSSLDWVDNLRSLSFLANNRRITAIEGKDRVLSNLERATRDLSASARRAKSNIHDGYKIPAEKEIRQGSTRNACGRLRKTHASEAFKLIQEAQRLPTQEFIEYAGEASEMLSRKVEELEKLEIRSYLE